MELHHPVAVVADFLYGGSQLPVSEADGAAWLHLLAGLAQALPASAPQIPQKQNLHCPAGGTVSQKPGGQHPGIVHYQAVPGIQIIQHIIKMTVGNFPGLPIQNHKPGGVALLQRGLRDQLFRQVIPIVLRLKPHVLLSFFLTIQQCSPLLQFHTEFQLKSLKKILIA